MTNPTGTLKFAYDTIRNLEAEIAALKQALAQPEQLATAQEPTDEALNTDALRYRWLVTNKVEHNGECWHFNHGPILWGPLGLGATIDQHIAAPQGEVK
jgi:hypothetical protein